MKRILTLVPLVAPLSIYGSYKSYWKYRTNCELDRPIKLTNKTVTLRNFYRVDRPHTGGSSIEDCSRVSLIVEYQDLQDADIEPIIHQYMALMDCICNYMSFGPIVYMNTLSFKGNLLTKVPNINFHMLCCIGNYDLSNNMITDLSEQNIIKHPNDSFDYHDKKLSRDIYKVDLRNNGLKNADSFTDRINLDGVCVKKSMPSIGNPQITFY